MAVVSFQTGVDRSAPVWVGSPGGISVMGHAQPRGQASDQASKVGQTGVEVTETSRFEGTSRRPDLPGVIRNADTDHGSNSTQERQPQASQIYQWVYAQPVSTLARELIRLRIGRPARRSGPRPVPAPRIREPRYLDERPAEVEGREVPGHWEGDLVIGKAGKSAVATLVERTSRMLVLVPLSGRDALTVGAAVIAAAGTLPPRIARSLTWDCGAEMAGHARITVAGLPVYFARPHSPWQRGSNENANRILREYFPKGVPITSDPKYLAMVASEINDRPRKIHNWKKPSEIFAELVEANASTA
jgi:transposase, IS30 family